MQLLITLLDIKNSPVDIQNYQGRGYKSPPKLKIWSQLHLVKFVFFSSARAAIYVPIKLKFGMIKYVGDLLSREECQSMERGRLYSSCK